MAFNTLPNSLQPAIQQGFLDREFRDALTPKLGFRDLAEREVYPSNIGETKTITRTGLLPTLVGYSQPYNNTDITGGMTSQNWGVEQFVMTLGMQNGFINLNVGNASVGLPGIFLQNAKKLANQAFRSVDLLAATAMFGAYAGGQTSVRVTLTSAGPSVSVDDIRGFIMTQNSVGQEVTVSASVPVSVVIGSNTYSCIGSAADATNVSNTPMGISGNLTLSTNVTVADGTKGNAVIAANASPIARVGGGSTAAAITASNTLTMQTILNAKTVIEGNGVDGLPGRGTQRLLLASQQLNGLYQDPEFQSFLRGRSDSDEYKKGIIAEILGVDIVTTNVAPKQTAGVTVPVWNAILVGDGALIEGTYTSNMYDQTPDENGISNVSISEEIAHVLMPPLEPQGLVWRQTYVYAGGFVCPTDSLTTPQVFSTANNATYKRALVIQSA